MSTDLTLNSTQGIGVRSQEINVAGQAIVTRILNLGYGESMTVADVAAMLGVTANNITKLVNAHGLGRSRVPGQTLSIMRTQGLVPVKTTVLEVLPKETIQALVKIVGTPHAWAAYRQLWQDAEELFAARLAKMEADMAEVIPTKREILGWPQLGFKDTQLILDAVFARIKALGLRGYDAKQAQNAMFGAVKRTYLPAKMVKFLSFKGIAHADVPAAVKLVGVWQPN